MQCSRCKENLDKRDILNKRTLSCWKCGFKRELTSEELREYVYEYDYNYSDDSSDQSYYKSYYEL